MQPYGGHTAELNPDDVLTEIDGVAYARYDREDQPAYLRATDDYFFKQGPTVGIGYTWDEDSNVGAFKATSEQEEITNEDVLIGNTKTVLSQKWTKQIPISDEAFKASMHGRREKIGEQVGDRARLTQDKEAIQRSWGDVFDGAFNTTPDGQAAASNSHTTLKGYTVDNLETGSLTPDNLWTQVVSLAQQKAQDNETGSHIYSGWLGAFTLYRTAKEVMDSQLIPNSAENNINIFETVYGQVRIKASVFLGSAESVASANADTSYHVISGNHMMSRRVFHNLETFMIRPEFTANHSYMYRALYHEVAYPETWEGFVSTNGTT